jgi:site-specific recombinase XerD
MNLSEALQSFIKHLEEQKRSQSTITAYTKDIEQLNSFLSQEGNIEKVDEVETENLNSYVEKTKSDKKYSYTLKTVSRKINSMKTYFKFLFSNQVINNNPSISVKHPKYQITPPRTLTKMEYMALRDVARFNPRLFTIVELLLQTGIRIGELARLTIDDINLDSNKECIKICAYGSNGERTVKLNDSALLALKNYLKVRPQPKEGINALFVTKNGNPLLVRNIRTSITRALQKIGINNATVNDIRNTFIVHQLRNGGMTVGHKRLTSTKRYLDLIENKSKRKSTRIVPL